MGLTWATPTIPGSVVAVSMLGRAAWALVTRCHIGRLTCRLTLLASDDGGATWSVQAAQPPDPVVSGSAAFSAEFGQSSLLAVGSNRSAGHGVAGTDLDHEQTHAGDCDS